MKFSLLFTSTALAILAVTGCSRAPQMSDDDARALTASRLKQLAVAVKRYSERNRDVLPDLSTPEAMKADLKGYFGEHPVGSEEILLHPTTGQPFQPNPSLSKVNELTIDDSEKRVLLYEDPASTNDTRAVIYEDGHFKRLPESDWPAIKAYSKIP